MTQEELNPQTDRKPKKKVKKPEASTPQSPQPETTQKEDTSTESPTKPTPASPTPPETSFEKQAARIIALGEHVSIGEPSDGGFDIGPVIQPPPPKPRPPQPAPRNWMEDLVKRPSVNEERLMLFKNYLDEHWGPPAVTVLFRALFSEGGYPPIPLIEHWDIPKDIDVLRLVWEQVQTVEFIDEIWPSITMMLGDNILNYEWAARIATVLSFFNIIRVLSVIREDPQ